MMADTNGSDVSLLPDEMLKFVLESAHGLLQSPRTGRILSHCQPSALLTPNFIAATSRGVVPHISQDVLQKHTDIGAVYMGLEDCTFSTLSRQPSR